MRIVCTIVSVLGLLLLALAWRGWTGAEERRVFAAETQQVITELQRLVQMHDHRIQSLPDNFTARLDDEAFRRATGALLLLSELWYFFQVSQACSYHGGHMQLTRAQLNHALHACDTATQ